MTLPSSLEETVLQAKEATKIALESGSTLVQVELLIPEIALQAQAIALQFTELFAEHGAGLRVVFPDTGAAMLARRDWGETIFRIGDLGSRFIPVDDKISPDDTGYLVVCPSAVEINALERLCGIAGDRPVVLLIPQLEDVAIIGIGYAARQLRDRFLSRIETAYYFRPLEGAIVYRSYPSPWQVYLEKEEDYELIASESSKPIGEALESIIFKATATDRQSDTVIPQKTGLFANMGRFLKALRQ